MRSYSTVTPAAGRLTEDSEFEVTGDIVRLRIEEEELCLIILLV